MQVKIVIEKAENGWIVSKGNVKQMSGMREIFVAKTIDEVVERVRKMLEYEWARSEIWGKKEEC